MNLGIHGVEQMRLLVFTSEYPPYGDTQVVHYFTRQWVKQGVEVDVVYQCDRLIFPLCYLTKNKVKRQPAGKMEQYTLEGVNVLKVPISRPIPNQRKRTPYTVHSAVKAIEKFTEGKKYDFVINHYCSYNDYLVERTQSIFGVKKLAVFHGCDVGNPDLVRKIVSEYDYIAARSDAIIRKLRDICECPDDVRRIDSGVPAEYLDGGMYHAPGYVYKFVYAGKLIKRKQVDQILEAAAMIGDQRRFFVEIIGDGTEKRRLEKLLKERRLEDKVRLLGALPRSETYDHMKKADCFVMVSIHETLGLVYLEAMSAGCLVIGSKGEGIDGIIQTGKNGFLVDPRNLYKLRDVMVKCMAMAEDERRRIVTASLKTVKTMSDESVARDYMSYIEACMERT